MTFLLFSVLVNRWEGWFPPFFYI